MLLMTLGYFLSAPRRVDLANRKSGKGEELGGQNVPSPDSDPRSDAEFGKISRVCHVSCDLIMMPGIALQSGAKIQVNANLAIRFASFALHTE